MTGTLYTLRYRHGQGVITTFITADSDRQAQQIGEVYVNQMFNARFIKVERAISADASILTQVGIPPVGPSAAPDDESALPVTSKPRPERAEVPFVAPNPAKERALDAEQEAEDLRELREQEALAAKTPKSASKR